MPNITRAGVWYEEGKEPPGWEDPRAVGPVLQAQAPGLVEPEPVPSPAVFPALTAATPDALPPAADGEVPGG